MGLAASGGRHARRIHGSGGACRKWLGIVCRPQVARGRGRRWRIGIAAHGYVIMRRHFRNIERMRGFAAALPQNNAVTHMHGHAALEIGKREGSAPVSAVGGAQDRKQSLVLVDRQQLPIAEGPAFGWKIPADDFYFAQKWL